MIDKALKFSKDILDQFLKNEMGLEESKVLINNIIDGDGTIPQINQNKVVISLINLEKETLRPFYTRNNKLPDGNYSLSAPVERYNLDVLITSNFDDYNETLKFLNASILFFQTNPCISASSNSNIPDGLGKLEFELENVSYHQMHSLWSAMGAKYQPSVIYKTRLVTLDANEIDAFDPSISQNSNSASA
ncbi:DUF4255 domain-containing protein [uncultured Winogradskyella sp.]|uniref:DUF4255 domain-containing protein n=1 Tax=uncultured Winogradskyella sp. TaxID=395353 RepID=UPI0026160346|nr:DUF4255 domain-containing protein [uncultured Winogradskyella sp.]